MLIPYYQVRASSQYHQSLSCILIIILTCPILLIHSIIALVHIVIQSTLAILIIILIISLALILIRFMQCSGYRCYSYWWS